ncbi:UNVERIFIED_CONTAM: Receptor-like protein 6 [Sesamum latifolium]|uniref:Receptor-like protein 6 n=1 Tax=Sesamum latifolium TaxID=2727402 RepID=A0AAW2XCN4_9LAMI
MFPSVLFILLFFSNSGLGVNPTFVSGQGLQGQKELLVELRNNLTYDSSFSTKLVQWNESIADCCLWAGVKCDTRGRVSSLDLSDESISDGINDAGSSLFRLVFLENLSLAQNSFSSIDLPLGFGKLTELRYLNLSNSGFSGQIPLDFSNLTRLVVLDLTNTIYSSLKLENPNLERLIHNFTRLRELYLDGVNISAKGPEWCNAISSSLPNLRVLSLSNAYLTGPIDSSLVKLRSLSVIRLDENTFSSPFPEFFADFPSLRVLTISSCNLLGEVPAKLFQVKSLQTIDLSGNRDLEGSLPEFPLNGSLQNLWLSYTKFSGNVSESIGSLRMLSNLDLRGCGFSGPIPSSIKNLTQLVYLDLSINQFVGSVPSFAFLKNLSVINLRGNLLTGRIPDSLWEGLEKLSFLDLSENSLEGELPASLFVLPSINVLHLNDNSFSGVIRDLLNSSSPLEVLELNVNNFEGPIPQFLFGLQNLSSLSLSANKFNGSVQLTDFRKLTNLVSLDLSYNHLSVHVSETAPLSSLFPRLGTLMLASCKLQKFPLLRNLSSLMMLDLSDNQLHGEIPNWTWEVGDGVLRFLNLSHNQFTHLQEPYEFRYHHYLDLHSNMLRGEIPIPPRTAAFVDMSSNHFSSPLPANIGYSLTSAFYFSLANNSIVGTIPPSLCNATRLQILDLSNNKLHDRIPSCLFENTLGEVPNSLVRCTEMKVLNLGNNDLTGNFPCWLKNLTRLRVLVLSNNKFHGNISCLGDGITWPNLQIIDIASNQFNSVLPENLFRDLKALTVDEDGLYHLNFVYATAYRIYYQDSVTLILKNQGVELEKILNIFTSIDFSNNHFSGTCKIPLCSQLLTQCSLRSHPGINWQSGGPRIVRPLIQQSGGEIPQQLASLTFLSFLNLSYNNLVGRIPQGSQMQTFPDSSFLGNEGLCGFPLNKTCTDHSGSPAFQQPTSEEEEENQKAIEHGIYVSAALGFVVGVGVIFGPLALSERWRRCYNKNVNKVVLLVLGRHDHQLENEDW